MRKHKNLKRIPTWALRKRFNVSGVRFGLAAAPFGALLLISLCLGGAGALAQDKAACPRDLLVADSGLTSAVAKLSQAAQGSDQDRCAAWRNQIAMVKRARDIYGRCAPERARTPQFLQTASGAGDLEHVVKERCGR